MPRGRDHADAVCRLDVGHFALAKPLGLDGVTRLQATLLLQVDEFDMARQKPGRLFWARSCVSLKGRQGTDPKGVRPSGMDVY